MSVRHWLLIQRRNSSGAEPWPSVPQLSFVPPDCASVAQLGDRVHVDRRMHRERLDQEEQARDQHQVLVDVVGQVGEHHRIERELIVEHHADRVAVARARRAGLAPGMPAAPPRFSITTGWPSRGDKFVRRRAHDDVGEAAGGDRHDHADRPLGVILRSGRRDKRRGQCECCKAPRYEACCHGHFPLCRLRKV